MDKNILYAAVIAFLLNTILSPYIIQELIKLKLGQNVRQDGLETHLKKAGTPSMGGIIFLISTALTSCLFFKDNKELQSILFITMGYGIVGFLDDYIKVAKKRSEGLTPIQKLLGQLGVTIIFAYLLAYYVGLDTNILIPFTDGKFLDLGPLYYPFLVFAVLGLVNAVNLTDGVDGLAGSVTVLVATFFAAVAWGFNSGSAPIAAAMAGSLLGFLLFNSYPAKVFMGDTGSLALGGFVSAMAFILKMPLFILIIGIIYIIETLSVIIQVSYFKKTHKRVFRMAPYHHHLEKGGWEETKVVSVFAIITAIMCLIGLMAI
ncbi:phospho-N-acetylmuramoyl-pentapeptide-transferase [Candidatus Epulonipiscium fishelsonii]|uniref:Phospho-N-acetylmuramoyl-pentapeptide-transferase n=1 Tax=Candidatus Epulonipiscium fishelsonii TaxID=77094 RepID=A0ACC8XFX7_9FIRM|nr:phospho-N-acetylmuramoyl-pentapeptide-transferase [Epulopiscium sp. SCG-B11WGA-EpuloA1]